MHSSNYKCTPGLNIESLPIPLVMDEITRHAYDEVISCRLFTFDVVLIDET